MHYIFAEEREGMIAIDIWKVEANNPSININPECIRDKYETTSQRNKPRLLLALYARPKYPESYHYALLITPKITAVQNTKSLRATKYHVKNTIENIKDRISQPWRFERVVIDDINLEPWLLTCVVIGKVVSQEHVEGKKRMGRWNAGQDTSVELRVSIMDLVTESEITT
ncbi:hypothetical protein F9C07_2254184 [Aspergillus flavus]|uniref:Uncharacterized protein n=1 Tax=Aspergillus flavus (strain ATCC 200026 / FGSC A1120 / IAM 13836 / NRRL 3357 / JCM 12722 / SRRC 167) TaxID=332952 RepID=A0A7U2MKL1_ASPFN|nr:hypothetical protein F9C07_2254184 [Aspergillus flavus]